jgi:hypothetical protein
MISNLLALKLSPRHSICQRATQSAWAQSVGAQFYLPARLPAPNLPSLNLPLSSKSYNPNIKFIYNLAKES